MQINLLIKKIDSYLNSERHTPIIVDVQNPNTLNAIYNHFNVGSNKVIKASDFCGEDTLPHIDKLQYTLSIEEENVLLMELSTFLKLQGIQELKRCFKIMLDLSVSGKLVMLTYQCKDYLQFNDPRLYESSRIIIADSEPLPIPTVLFIDKNKSFKADIMGKGIKDLPWLIELSLINDAVCIKTAKSKHDFPNSLLGIKDLTTSYGVLTYTYPEFESLEESAGTEEQWEYLIQAIDKCGNWINYLNKTFGGIQNLLPNARQFSKYDNNKQWAYYIALRKHGTRGNKYLSMVINDSTDFASFINGLYSTLLKIDIKQTDFSILYNQRKEILAGLSGYTLELSLFCKQLEIKGDKAIYYLTDITQVEREKIIELIAKYSSQLEWNKLQNILKSVYPDLYYYTLPFKSGIELIDSYIQIYKQCKTTNQILPEIKSIVNQQALRREYNIVLQPRSLYVDKLDKIKSALYFVDALGVEFLSYIQQKCFERKLNAKIQIARCELPSITSVNKDFLQSFKDAGCKIYDIKNLDDIKHHGQKDYNYQNTKLPIHIVQELIEIDNILANIENSLALSEMEKAMIISDHGASRLAVINETENKIEVKEKGLHSGRCCPKADISEKPDFATEENDFWCLANYELFKGGRKTGVEVHGGATLEEVTVPIIEITKKQKEITCYILPESRIIFVSFKNKAQIKLFVDQEADRIIISVNGKMYSASKTDMKYYYTIDMSDIKKAGIYSCDVQVDGNIVAKDLTFEVKKEGASERKFF